MIESRTSTSADRLRPGGRSSGAPLILASAALLALAAGVEPASATEAVQAAVVAGAADEPATGSAEVAAAPSPGAWARSIGTDRREYATSIALGSDGSIFLTGFFLGGLDGAAGEPRQATAGDSDVLLVKLDAAGETLWARRFGAASADEGRAVAVGPTGDVYVTGFFSGSVDFDPGNGRAELVSAGSSDVFVARLSAEGELVWARRVGGAAGDTSYDLAVDADGRVHVAGYFQGEADFDPGDASATLAAAGGLDGFWLRLDGDGHYLGAGRFGGKGTDEARAIAAMPDGGSVVCGVFRGTAGWGDGEPWTSRGASDTFLVGVTAGGETRRLLHLGGASTDECADLAVSGDGGVLLTGHFSDTFPIGEGDGSPRFESHGGSDALVVALDPDGAVRWTRSIGENGNDFGFAIAPGDGGTIWTAGFHQPVANEGGRETRSFVTLLEADSGTPIGSQGLEAGAGIQLLTLAVGPDGAPHVAGVYGGEATVELAGTNRTLPGAGKIDVIVARLPRLDP